jgi:DNA-directed RNA polymerase specialized sigma24 family protein
MAEAPDSDALLKAIAALLVDQREARVAEPGQRRTEEILAGVGLSAAEIAEVTGKQTAAVRMTLSRARRAKSKPSKKNG